MPPTTKVDMPFRIIYCSSDMAGKPAARAADFVEAVGIIERLQGIVRSKFRIQQRIGGCWVNVSEEM